MGMFDDIDAPDAKCLNCGAKLIGLQSKDGPCLLECLPFWEVTHFYGSCESCGKWNTFTLEEKRPPIPLSFYKQQVRE